MRCAKQFSLTVEEVSQVCPDWGAIAIVDPLGYITGDGSAFSGTTASGGHTSFNTAPLAVSGINCSIAVLRLSWTISNTAPLFNFPARVEVWRNPGAVIIAAVSSPVGVLGSGSAELQFAVPSFATSVFIHIEAGNIQAFTNTVVTLAGSVTNDGIPP